MREPGFAFRSGVVRLKATLLATALLAVAPATSLPAQSAPAAEIGAFRAEVVHAAFLINFIRFTEWPGEVARTNAPFTVGVAGSRALEDELIMLAEKQTVRNRRIRVIRIKNIGDLAACQVLYIHANPGLGDEGAPSMAELLAYARGKPVLTVSESPNFLAQGGIVNFYPGEKGTVRFEIAPDHAREAGLLLSSRLLALARIVRPPKPSDGIPGEGPATDGVQ